MNRAPRIAIVGGGISGLAAANRLVDLDNSEFMLLEAGNRLGGVISTGHRDGYLWEGGPESFITEKPAAMELAKRLGIDHRLIGTSDTGRRSYVVRSGRLHPIPEGLMMLAPSRVMPFLQSPIISWPGKLRAMVEPLIPARRGGGDESLASFVSRRLGREVLDRLAAPLAGGVYGGDPDNLGLAATMPRFLDLERKYGSLIRGLRAQSGKQRGVSGARYGLFATFDGGMETIVDAIVERLPSGAARLGCSAESVVQTDSGWEITTSRPVGWNGELETNRLTADGVIIALPAWRAADLLGALPDVSKLLSGIRYGSSVNVNLAYDEAVVSNKVEGFGFVVPAIEGLPMLACTVCSTKFADRAPQGNVLVRVFLNPETLDWSDDTIVDVAHRLMERFLGVKAGPLFSEIARHRCVMPQYGVGHLDLVARIDSEIAGHAGLALAGNGYRGVGVPDCIAAGERAAETSIGSIRPELVAQPA